MCLQLEKSKLYALQKCKTVYTKGKILTKEKKTHLLFISTKPINIV